jgi:hypothetical protein
LTDPNNKSSPVNPKEKHKKIAHPYAKYNDICNPSPGGYGAPEIHQYERLIKAAELDRDAAIMSCSWGVFQVMGIYYKQFGYIFSIRANFTKHYWDRIFIFLHMLH